jgi:endonuclease/exonuclease/phosphatase family metal-dependent hydrolase
MAVLITGYSFISRTFSMNSDSDGSEERDFSVLSYNVRVFNTYEHLKQGGKASEGVISFATDFDADIKCFQEYYNYPGSDSFQTTKRVKKNSSQYFIKPVQTLYGQEFGLAIFSKYPIINKGEIKFPHRTFNQAIYADIVIRSDTLRVFNVHLQSMSIDESNLPQVSNDPESKSKFFELIRKLKKGSELRSIQIELLLKEIKQSPYKIILAGDLNDTPYSYSYESLRQLMKNAFEEKGNGLGFTYNGKLFFLRIDNIFYDKNLTLNTFKVLEDVKFSDHYPLFATFKF